MSIVCLKRKGQQLHTLSGKSPNFNELSQFSDKVILIILYSFKNVIKNE